MTPDVSIVLGSLNRRRLLNATIESIRNNGFEGKLEIIVVDGGSSDGSCDWLAKQRDILTIIQPNYRELGDDGVLRLKHSWGKFINLGFKHATAPWVLMVSDDLLLCPGAITNGLQQMINMQREGQKIGGGALFWRDFPRDRSYHVKLLPGRFIHINHGFYWKEALAEIGYADEKGFEFYGADGDLTIRLNLAGWKTVALDSAYAEHLNHRVDFLRLLMANKTHLSQKDMDAFERKYMHLESSPPAILRTWKDSSRTAQSFLLTDPWACLQGGARRLLRRKQ